MTKLCSVCGTENKDEAQFCRACGTAFPSLAPTPAPSAEEAQLAAGITCDECGFQNKPGIRYCANCGVSLLGTVIVPRARGTPPPAAADPYAGLSPPPISYPSFAPVGPYPPAPAPADSLPHDDPLAAFGSGPPDPAAYPPDYADPNDNLDIPDADAALAVREQEAEDARGAPAEHGFGAAPAAPNRTPMIVGGLVLALAVAGGAAWWFMSKSGRATPPVAAAASAPEPLPVTAAAAASAPASEPAAAVTAVAVPPAASTPDATAPPPLVGPGETVLVPAGSPPPLQPGASPFPFPVDASASAPSDAEAKRLAAEKRREKAAKDKADRDAKAKLQADQQAAIAARAEQEAQAKRRVDEAQRPRPTTSAPVPQQQAVPAGPRGVREICAGRGTISEAICQSRECGAQEHANEAVCKQVREREDRQRNYNN